LIRRFMQQSQTRVHASPPSIAALHAAESALQINAKFGDALRRHLAELVLHFRMRMRSAGMQCSASLFPIQPVSLGIADDPVYLYRMLRTAGVRTLLTKQGLGSKPCLLFILNATHSFEDVDRAAAAVEAAINSSSSNKYRRWARSLS
jgi:8-amino-7-oxononanoate synthase